MVAVALVFDTHLQDLEWNSLFDDDAILVAAKVTVINISVACWYFSE
jgi:hypothetical protein